RGGTMRKGLVSSLRDWLLRSVISHGLTPVARIVSLASRAGIALLFPLTLAAQTPTAVFTQYCVTCHNARLKTAGLVIDPAEAAHPATNPELWEKVVRKLRSASMPPAGSPRPDPATYDATATFLEAELDRAAA